MRLLIIAATEAEISGWIHSRMKGDVLVTGVGVTNSLHRISRALTTQKYDLAIQAGVAGAFRDAIGLGEVVAVTSDVFADEGISEKGIFTPLSRSHLVAASAFPYSEGMLVNPALPDLPSGIRKVRAVTVGMITDSKERTAQLEKAFQPDIESMEGASLHFAAIMERTHFLQLRAVSNRVGDRNKENWKLEEAVQNLNEALISICKALD